MWLDGRQGAQMDIYGKCMREEPERPDRRIAELLTDRESVFLSEEAVSSCGDLFG